MGAAAASNNASYLQSRLDLGMMDMVNQTVTASLQGHESVFSTAYSFFIGAAMLEIVCIALILPT